MSNSSLRVAITKVRLSSHIFYIERGRWGPNRIAVNDRRCNICNVVEDEYHCLIRCPCFNNECSGLLPFNKNKDISKMSIQQLLNTKNSIEQRKLGLLCFRVLKEYRELL